MFSKIKIKFLLLRRDFLIFFLTRKTFFVIINLEIEIDFLVSRQGN